MSVLIKDIDIPKQCIECPLCKHIHVVNSPLLIYACGKGMRPMYLHETAEGVDEFSKMQKPDWCPIKEVKHGKWIVKHTFYESISVPYNVWSCSSCGYVRKRGWAATQEGQRPTAVICENCGARMDK